MKSPKRPLPTQRTSGFTIAFHTQPQRSCGVSFALRPHDSQTATPLGFRPRKAYRSTTSTVKNTNRAKLESLFHQCQNPWPDPRRPAAPVDGRDGGPKSLRYNPRLRNGRRASRPGTRDAWCRMTVMPKSRGGSVTTRTSAVCAARAVTPSPQRERGVGRKPCPRPRNGGEGFEDAL